jgi:TRAP-type C4-dicarboxylate transport system substrate-binding protein
MMMKRSLFLVLLLVVAVSTVNVAVAAAGSPMVLKFGNASAPDKLASVLMEQFCKDVTDRTGGAVVCKWFPSQQLGSNAAQLENMMAGNQDGNAGSIETYGTYVKDIGILSVPFVFEDVDHQAEWLASPDAAYIFNQLRNKFNIRIITYDFKRLPRVIITKKKVTVPADLKGMKFRVANIPMQEMMFKNWGATTTYISFAEYPMALMQGVVSAGETSCESFETSKFHLYAPYIAEVNFAYPLDCLVMAESTFKKLTGGQQKIIYECAAEMTAKYNARVQKDWEAYKPTMIKEGAKFVKVNIKVWRNSMTGFYRKLEKQHYWTKKGLFDSIKAIRTQGKKRK